MNSALPFTLDHPLEAFRKCLREENWSKAFNYQLDFLETGAAYTSVVLLGLFRKEALKGQAVPAGVLGAVKRIDQKRPLSFGDWVNDILTPLSEEAGKAFPGIPFAQDLSKVVNRKKNLFLGGKSEQSLVQIRNMYKGHGTTMSEDLYRQIVETMEPRAEQFAEALSQLPQCGLDFAKDLYPLVHESAEGYEYVFQTLNDEEVSYISSHESAVTVHTAATNPDFDRWMQALEPSFDIAKALNWSELVEAMGEASQQYMQEIYSQKKYNRELFVEREQLSAVYNEFLDSDRILFPLPGEAGQGKTNQLCHWTESLLEAGEAVLIFAGSEFAEYTLEQRLKEIFGLSHRKDILQYLDRINALAKEGGKRVYVFFDAVNESIDYPGLTVETEGPLMLYRDIYRLFGRSSLDAFRVLFTCRSYTWKNDLVPEQSRQDASLFFAPDDEDKSSVQGFTDSEVRQAYSIYGNLYQMETPFDSLERGFVLRLKDPLMLKIACTNYLGTTLPQAQRDYTSFSLMDKMLSDIARSYAGKNQVLILDQLSKVMLAVYESGNAVDSVAMDDLRAALDDSGNPLHTAAELMFKRDGITVAFAELLSKPERPVLRLTDQSKVQFIYERLLEFLLGRAYYRRDPQVTADKVYRTLKDAATNEVFMGAMRTVLLSDYLATGSAAVLTDLVTRYGDDFEVFSLVSGTLDVMVREIYADEIFSVEREMLQWKEEGMDETIREFNAVCREIDANRATDEVIAKHKELSATLTPLIRLRNLAGVTLISGVLLSDARNESLYAQDPFQLLWMLMEDPVVEVRNEACMQSYYVSHRSRTLGGEALRQNVTAEIVSRMFAQLRGHSLPGLVITARRRNRTVSFLETGVRLDVLLIIDLLLSGKAEDRVRVTALLDEIRGIFRHLTLNYSLVRILMPFFAWILRRQVTFQSAYVNNLTEYTTFWNDALVPPAPDGSGRWNRQDIPAVAPYAFLYSRYAGPEATHPRQEMPDIDLQADRIAAAYQTGDSLSYFLLERILVIMGLSDWKKTLPILKSIEKTVPGTEWFDYSQMSFIYVLYQLGLKMDTLEPEVADMLERACRDWTLRCRGYFSARNSHVANPLKLYKRNVMSWYAMVWCAHNGDKPDESGQSVPLFRELLAGAIKDRDKELLVHLVNNISELITDSGDIYTALDLIKVVFEGIPSQEVLDEFDAGASDRYPDTSANLITLFGNILGTAKNYFPAQVNDFLARGVIGLGFPGIPKYKDDILSYNPGGEKLSDLFTHKFGNFIIWALIHEESVDEVVADCLKEAASTQDSAAWFDRGVRIVLRSLLKIKI